jgi:hypothetical protein
LPGGIETYEEFKKVDRQLKALYSARRLLPSLLEEQSTDATAQEMASEGEDLDSEPCLEHRGICSSEMERAGENDEEIELLFKDSFSD